MPIRAEVSALLKEFNEALHAAQHHHDPLLSAEGLAQKRGELQEAVRATYAPRIAELRAQGDREVQSAREQLEAHRPSGWADAASIARMQARWDQTRMKLQAGIPMHRVLATADIDTVHAIREWGPAWLEAEQHREHPEGRDGVYGSEPIDTSGLMRAIDGRLSALNDDFGDLVAAARDAEVDVAGSTPLLAHVEHVLEGAPTNGLDAAVASAMGAQQVEGDYAGVTVEA